MFNYLGLGRGKTKAKGIYPKTLTTPTYKDLTVGCVASAIVFALAKSGFYGSNFQNNISGSKGQKIWVQKAKLLQGQLSWGGEVLISQIQDFVKAYSIYRIVVVDLALKSSKTTDWKGAEYVKDGSGSSGYQNDPADQATFNYPYSVFVAHGSIYVADTYNHAIRKIASDGSVSTLAGKGTSSPGGFGTTSDTGFVTSRTVVCDLDFLAFSMCLLRFGLLRLGICYFGRNTENATPHSIYIRKIY